MFELFILILVAVCGVIGSAYAINFFWRIGIRLSLKYAAFFVSIFFIFWLSGVWVDADRHAWGRLIPVFLLMLAAGALVVWIGKKVWNNLYKSWQGKK